MLMRYTFLFITLLQSICTMPTYAQEEPKETMEDVNSDAIKIDPKNGVKPLMSQTAWMVISSSIAFSLLSLYFNQVILKRHAVDKRHFFIKDIIVSFIVILSQALWMTYLRPINESDSHSFSFKTSFFYYLFPSLLHYVIIVLLRFMFYLKIQSISVFLEDFKLGKKKLIFTYIIPVYIVPLLLSTFIIGPFFNTFMKKMGLCYKKESSLKDDHWMKIVFKYTKRIYLNNLLIQGFMLISYCYDYSKDYISKIDPKTSILLIPFLLMALLNLVNIVVYERKLTVTKQAYRKKIWNELFCEWSTTLTILLINYWIIGHTETLNLYKLVSFLILSFFSLVPLLSEVEYYLFPFNEYESSSLSKEAK